MTTISGSGIGVDPTGTVLHRRSLTYDVSDPGEGCLAVVGRLRDERPWADGASSVALVHDLELRVRVRLDDLVIEEAEARMHTFPHTECPTVTDAFAGLAGLGIARGFTRAVQERFGGPRGCTHLDQLARSLGPVVIQAVTSRRARAVATGDAEDLISGAGSPWALDTCHIWASGGVAQQKLEAGWRPGIGPYPSLPLSDLRRRPSGAPEDDS